MFVSKVWGGVERVWACQSCGACLGECGRVTVVGRVRGCVRTGCVGEVWMDAELVTMLRVQRPFPASSLLPVTFDGFSPLTAFHPFPELELCRQCWRTSFSCTRRTATGRWQKAGVWQWQQLWHLLRGCTDGRVEGFGLPSVAMQSLGLNIFLRKYHR